MPEVSPILPQSLDAYESAVRERPEDIAAWFQFGLANKAAGRLDAAERCFRTVLMLDPRRADAYLEYGIILKRQGDLDGAIRSYASAVELEPRSAAGFFNLGNALRERGEVQQARSCYAAAVALSPTYAAAWNNFGLLLEEQGNLDDALSHYRRAAALNSDFAGAYVNIGNVLTRQNLLPGAAASYRRALEIQPDFPEAHHALGLALLGTGKLEEGWPEFEWRLRCQEIGARVGARTFPRPLWDGSGLRGRTLLVYAEQGYGDTIQFARFLPLIRKEGGQVMFGCYPDLFELFRDLPGVDRLVDITADTLPGFDTYVALLSVPGLLSVTQANIPSAVPYVGTGRNLQEWTQRINGEGVRVGLVWMSNTKNRIGLEKSLPLESFTPLASLTGISLYSLQKGEGAKELEAPPPGLNIRDLAGDINDFADTAAAIQCLDLVITVDTAVAHLAGALGKSVWTILPFAADWRWFTGRDDTPWYPTMRLFRQQRRGAWGEVIRTVREQLLAMVTAKEGESNDE
jgi:Tfp pilus assembly protein PilF